MHLILRILEFQETVDHVIPSFTIFIEESEDLKAKFLTNLPEIIDFLLKENFDTAIDQIVLNVFPTLENFLKKSTEEIQQKVIETLVKISEKIGKKEASSSLNNIILSLVGNFPRHEELIFKLLNAFAEKYIKMKEIKEFCKAYHEEYFKTKSPLAKKLLAHALASIACNCKKNTSRKFVLPLFLTLCEDPHWGVRKACVSSMEKFLGAYLSKHEPKEEDVLKLLLILDNMLKDTSKWVKNTLFSEFGRIIYKVSNYTQTDVSKNVDKLIVNYIEEGAKEDLDDAELINYNIAYNIPCIILVSNPKLWKFLRDNYVKLCGNTSLTVKTTLAASFHEVFKTLHGCQTRSMFEPHLVEIFCNFMSDVEQVKSKILEKSSEYWHLWSQETQELLFKVICDLYSFEDSWRLQKLKASFIKTIIQNYSVEKLTSQTMILKWEKFLESDNFSVQVAAAESLCFYISKIMKDGNSIAREKCKEIYTSYSTAKNYKQRILFIHMTHALIKEDIDLFKQEFSQNYVTLSQDKVKNVRILLAKTLLQYSEEIHKIPDLEDVEANLQDSGLSEIEILYNQSTKEEHCILPIKYDIFYLNFIDQPDPASSLLPSPADNPENPELLMDKSEDAYLLKNKSPKESSNSLPEPLSKPTSSIKDEFQEFDDFLAQIEP